MRFPGTINLIGNSLPTPEYLEKQRTLKQRRQAIRDGKITDESNKDKSVGQNASKINGDQKSSEDHQNKGDDGKGFGAVEFSPLQDKTIIDMKLKDAQWKAIATEIGREMHQVKERFKEIKPGDFDRRHREQKETMKEEKIKAKGGVGGGGNGESKDEQKDEQAQQGGGTKGKKNKGKGPAVGTAKKDDDDSNDEADGWWEQVDGNWSKEELEALMGISNEELRNAFVMISMRLSKELGKDVHPISVAEKILGTKPEWM